MRLYYLLFVKLFLFVCFLTYYNIIIEYYFVNDYFVLAHFQSPEMYLLKVFLVYNVSLQALKK